MDIHSYDAIIVGAGFAGATIAHELAKKNKKVLIIEKRNHIGGNMYETYDHARLRIHQYGPHIFHTNLKHVKDFLEQFGTWFSYEHRVVGKIDGHLVPIPFNFTSIDCLFSQEKASLLKEKLLAAFPNKTHVSVLLLKQSEDDDIRELGDFVFEKVFVHYTAKQWGVPIEQVDTSTINRVPVCLGHDDRYFQDTYQMMPMEGYTAIFERLLSHPNIDLRLGENAVEHLQFTSDGFYFDGTKCEVPFIFTGAVDELLAYRYGALPYRSLNLVFENYNLAQFQPASVVNYPNEEDFTRITEFKYLTRQQAASTTILKEYPLTYNYKKDHIPYYPINNEINNQLFQQYVRDLQAYSNFYLCGRLAEYKYYNMDAVIARALDLVKKL